VLNSAKSKSREKGGKEGEGKDKEGIERMI